MSGKVIVLGAGISGLSAAAHLAKYGFKVEILEKNATAGGRARSIEAAGFTFDIGPSWYFMPDVLEKFYNRFGHKASDFYTLKRLDPAFRVFYGANDSIDIPAKQNDLYNLFEEIEKGSGKNLRRFLKNAHQKYNFGMHKAIYKPYLSVWELFNPMLISGLLLTKSFKSYSRDVNALFKDKRITQILEFPVMFSGAAPGKISALYTLIDYALLKLGTWYPLGGMHKVVEALEKICIEQGVELSFNVNVDQLDVVKNKVLSAHCRHRNFYAEYFVSAADYYFTEQHLLSENHRNYDQKFWNSRIFAPSALMYFVGINKKVAGLRHHNLFFDTDLTKHAAEIYSTPRWPDSPAFFVTVPSVSDPTVAPVGCENLVILVPVAPGLDDHGKVRDHFFEQIISRIEKCTKTPIRENILWHKSYAHSDFINDYNAYRGNAFGLANTFNQTGQFKPKLRNRHVSNLFYAGHITVPGPGLPPALISGELAANLIFRDSGGHLS